MVLTPPSGKEEELEPLIHEVVEFKNNRDKGVVVAARNFMNVKIERRSD